jgi:protein-disulfide isomerase
MLGLLAAGLALPAHAGLRELLFGKPPARPFALASFVQSPSDAPVIGNPAARHIVLVFSDYNCPTCRFLEPYLTAAVRETSDIKLAVLLTPIVAPTSREVAKIALAAARLGTFGPLHERLLATRGKLDTAVALRTAASLGMDVAALNAAAKAPTIDAALDRFIAIHRANRLPGVPIVVAGSQGFVYGKETRLDFEPLFAIAREASKRNALNAKAAKVREGQQ